jgi:transcriptional regulator with XRE-family HTH domain
MAHNNRIREARQAAGLSIQELADKLGATYKFVWRLEAGQRHLRPELMLRIAKALSCDPLDLLDTPHITSNTATLVGWVSESGAVVPAEKKREAPLPSKANRLRGLTVRGNALWPEAEAGDVLLYQRAEGVDSGCLGRLCVIRTRGGATYVRRLRAGRAENLYRLTSPREPDIDDVEVEWAAPVQFVLKDVP